MLLRLLEQFTKSLHCEPCILYNIEIFTDSVGNIPESLFFGSSLGNAAWQPRDPDTDSFF